MSWVTHDPILIELVAYGSRPTRTDLFRYETWITVPSNARYDANSVNPYHQNSMFKSHTLAYLFNKSEISNEPVVGKYVLAKGNRVFVWTQTFRCTVCGLVSTKEVKSHVDSKSCRDKVASDSIRKSGDWVRFMYTFKRGHYALSMSDFFPGRYISKFADSTVVDGEIWVSKRLFGVCKQFVETTIASLPDPTAPAFFQGLARRDWTKERQELLKDFKLKFKISKSVDVNRCQCGAAIVDSGWAYTDGTTTIRLCRTHGEALAVCFDQAMSTM